MGHIITSAATWIGGLLWEEAKYLVKVKDKVEELEEELEWMKWFLREAEMQVTGNSLAQRWVSEARKSAYEAEDTLDEFLVNSVYGRGDGGTLLSFMRNISCSYRKFRQLHRIGSDTDKLKEKISALSHRLLNYGIRFQTGDNWSFKPLLSKNEAYGYYNFKEEKIIGRENHEARLIHELVNPKSCPIVAICGDAGVGKTFLARKIFHHRTIRREFNAFAWAYVSEPCQISSIQQELLSSLTSKSIEQINELTDDELKDGLYNAVLQKRCLVVLDGISSKEVWSELKANFPITNGGFASKLLLTTEINDLAKPVGENLHVDELTPLTEDQSRLLLQNKVRHVQRRISGGTDGYVEELLKRMLKPCGGFPLLILLLGGVLATKQTLKEWETVDKKIESYLIHHPEQQWRCILGLSYDELPYQLKPCFLDLGYFPTNLQISTRKIARLWEAEGLVSSTMDDETEDNVQDIAEFFLAELIERSLVQVGSRGLTGKAKTCHLHGIIRKFCLFKSSIVNWLSIIQLSEVLPQTSPSSSSPTVSRSTRSAWRRIHRLAIYCGRTLKKLPSDYRHAKYIRSLLLFNTLRSDDVLIPMTKKALRKIFTDFKLLRVLDMENIAVSRLPHEVGFLFLLRYLSLKGSWVSTLPSSIKHLRCLQTLDLRVLPFIRPRIPDVLHLLDGLVCLYLPPSSFMLRCKADKLQLRGLYNLETLANFSSRCRAEDLHDLFNLSRFTSCDFLHETQSLKLILGSGSFSSQMKKIELRLGGQILKEQRAILANCKHLRKLWVKGEITRSVEYVTLPAENLIHLTFHGSKFLDDPMPFLEKFPRLKSLSLENSSYEGTKMHCSKDGFKELSVLTLQGLQCLEEWEVEKGAMPKMQRLEINRCWKLKRIPEGLKFLESLQELELSYMPLSFYQQWIPDPENSLEEWPDFQKLKHVHSICISHVMDIDLDHKKHNSCARPIIQPEKV